MATAVVGAYLVWRYGRRKWRAFHAHGAVVGALALWEATATRRRRGTGTPSMDDVSGVAPRRIRKDMWRSVDQAASAIRTADELGAPTAELPSLCRRLQAAATDLDKVLRVDSAGPAPAQVAAQAVEIMRAARDVQEAAVASASDSNRSRVADLTRDAEQEIQLLDAGLASAQAALPPQHRR
jgi:succinate dehydrogenase/fumarate reductase flavoprotein subunit